jgi:hypothetical protein
MASKALDIRDYLLQNLVQSNLMIEQAGGLHYVDSLDLTHLVFIGDNFTYGKPTQKPYGDPQFVDCISRINNTDRDQTEELDRTYETEATFAWSVTEAIKNAGKVTVKCGLPLGINVSTEYSIELSTDKTETQTSSTKQSWTVQTPTIIPKRKKVVTQVIVNKANFSTNFTFNGELTGEISFMIWSDPPGSDPNLAMDFKGDIAQFIPGMPMPPELSMENGKLFFNGNGKFTGVAGIAVEVRSDQYPLEQIKSMIMLP